VAAFRATLEELEDADLLLHVVDITHQNSTEQIQVVDETLENLGLQDKPVRLVLNKVDLLIPESNGPGSLSTKSFAQGIEVSALKGLGLDRLLRRIDSTLAEVLEVSFPWVAVQ